MSLVSDISNFVNKQLGTPFDPLSSAKKIKPADEPWKNIDSSGEAFFKPLSIDADKWNKLFPYRLLVIDVTKGNQVVGGAKAGLVNKRSETPKGDNGGIEYVYSQEVLTGSWELTLPITPQQLSITDQFAINTTATMRGIVEEHNGIKFKNISASGTTGIWARKPTTAGIIRNPTSLGSILGGSLQAFSGVVNNISSIAKSFSGQHPNSAPKAIKPKAHDSTQFSTGYYQALYLGQFLERYAQEKKKPLNKGWRLIFDMPKTGNSFVVTPVSFSLNQSQQKPNEMLFNMQFKAWKRIDLGLSVQTLSTNLIKLETKIFQRIVRTIAQTRKTLSSSINLIKAVRSDFNKPLEVLRQTSLVVKDLGGFVFTVADLPSQLIQDYKSSIKQSLLNVKGAFNRPVSRGGSGAGGSGGTFSNSAVSIRSSSSSIRAGAAINALVAQNKFNEGLSQDAVTSGALGISAIDSLNTDPLNNIFANPEEYFELFDTVLVDDLSLTSEQQQPIEDELEDIRLINIDDLRDFKATLLELALQISNNYGAGNQTYSDVYGLQDPRSRALDMTVEENEVLIDIYESIQAFDLLTSTKQFDDFKIESPLEYVGGLANESGINFDISTSKFLVPVPFGSTIEEIAARYLKDADKWLEIATLNALRSPYIDEEGFSYSLLSNGEGRQFNINDIENKLFLGQRITLQSDTVPVFSRKIIDIEKLGEGNFLVSVDGDTDLDILKFSENARMQGYLPGTVNSQNQIYIPSNLPTDEDDRVFQISHLDEPNLTKVSKVDFLLTDNYDVALNSIGDFRLANGLTNLVQALRLKIITQRGTLLRHLDYGLGLTHGISVADIDNGVIINSLNQMVEADNRFDSITRMDIRLNGSTLNIDLAVKIANNSGIVPVSFNINI